LEDNQLECINDIGYLLNKAARISKLKVNQKLSEIGLTFPQLLIIKHLVNTNSNSKSAEVLTHTPATIAEHLGYDRPTITGIIDRLVKQGFVSRETNPNDRRSQTITLTQKSRELVQKMDIFFEEVNQRTLAGFQSMEIGEIKTYLLRIINNLDESGLSI
jgi:DNA-binding MarR family transcriptional regulator